jgi:exodeoxyribonuclease VII large subunit
MKISVEDRKNRLTSLAAQLDTLSPFKVLLRGYSITFNNQNGSVIREAKYVTQGDEIRTLVSDGEIISRVLNTGLNPVDSTIPDK